jgi:hypothetical protein
MDQRLLLEHVRLGLAALAAAGWLNPLALPGASLPAGASRPNIVYIFTSDNGCSPAANVRELEGKGHYPSYVFHGYCQPWMES